MKRKTIAVIVCISVVTVLAGVKIATNQNDKIVDEVVLENVVAVEVDEIKESEIIKYKKFTGVLVSGQSDSVAATAIANIKTIDVKVGDKVKKGQTIMTLDSSKLDEQIQEINEANDKVQEGINSANGKIDEVRIKLDENNIKKQEMHKELEVLQEESDSYDKTIEELKLKFDNAQIAKEEFDGKSKEVKKLKDDNKLKTININQEIKKIEITISTLSATIEQLEKVLGSNTQNTGLGDVLEVLEEKKGQYSVKSKISGVVKEINFKIGKMPINIMKPGILIENYDTLDLNFQVSKEDMEKIKKEKEIDVFVESQGQELKKTGRIENVSNEIDEKTNMYNVVVNIDNSKSDLKVGNFTRAYLNVDSKKQVLTVRKDAILRENDEEFVYICENGVAVKKPIITGIENHEVVEVLEGIKPLDKVITKGKEFVIDNEKVNIVNGGNQNENN